MNKVINQVFITPISLYYNVKPYKILLENLVSRVKGFRFDDELVKNIEKESERNGTNLNNYVRNTLEKHYKTYSHLERLHYQWISRKFLGMLLKEIPEDKIGRFIKVLEEDLRQLQRYSYADLNSQNIMEMILDNFALQDIPIHKKKLSEHSVKYNIVHGLGNNWSLIFLGAITNLISKTDVKVEKVGANKETISFIVHHTKDFVTENGSYEQHKN